MPQALQGDTRDRFVGFAFAAAELLVELTSDGRISYAAGAFRSRFGQAAEAYVGSDIRGLIAPGDQFALEAGLKTLNEYGRLAPMTIRLADRQRTAVALAGLVLAVAHVAPRLCMTFALLPVPLDSTPTMISALGFARAADARIREQAAGEIGLLEVIAQGTSPASRDDIGFALERVAPDGFTTEIAPGRYGVLQVGRPANELAAIAQALEDALRAQGVQAGVSAQAIQLEGHGLSTSQAARALRQALGVFARKGMAGVTQAGLAGGLAGYVAQATQHVAALGAAIQGGRFDLAYQPIVSLRDGRVHHYEALLRPHPISGCPLDSPQDFVLLAETLGLIERLDLAVATLACAAAQAADVAIAFNISGQSAQSSYFRNDLLLLLSTSPAGKAGRMIVEMTETAEVEDVAAVAQTATALRKIGVKFCLDDFGAGTADVRILRALPTDVVKLDGSYIPGIGQPGRERAFVSGMVDIARASGAAVVAERVESEAEAAALRGLGVDFAQGWLFGRPGPLPRRPGAARG